MEWDLGLPTSVTMYEFDKSMEMKQLLTVDQSQINDLEQTLSSSNRQTESEERHRHAGQPIMAESTQPPMGVIPPVPLVVEAKEAEEDDDERAKLPTRRRGDCTAAYSRQSIRQRSCGFSPAALGSHGNLPTSTICGGYDQPAFIPLMSTYSPKDDPQTVPCVGVTDKLERKRERNRLAARKCRERKVEQITVLQQRVQELNRTKVELERTADDLRRQVDVLQRHIRQHVNAGCQLAPRNGFTPRQHTVQVGSMS